MIMVRCSCCAGTGRVELTGRWAETLLLLRQHGREVTAAELSHGTEVMATAMSNRLAALERLGLASSRRDGRRRLFRPTPWEVRD